MPPAMAAVPPSVHAACAQPRHVAPRRQHAPRVPVTAAPSGGAALCCVAPAARPCVEGAPPLPSHLAAAARGRRLHRRAGRAPRCAALRRPMPRLYARMAQERRAVRAPQLSRRGRRPGGEGGGRGGHAAATCSAAGAHRHTDAACSAEGAARGSARAVGADCSLHVERALRCPARALRAVAALQHSECGQTVEREQQHGARRQPERPMMIDMMPASAVSKSPFTITADHMAT
mmetsp:Transcript_38593/g.106523  ORF Transcript_38593/g.106523 Transcript_38593/m.106523 type:complete len:233 (+) Transcript_38593:2094-2792(+)